MRLIFFTIPAVHLEPGASELNHFLATQRVAQVEKSLVADGVASVCAVGVAVVEGTNGRPSAVDSQHLSWLLPAPQLEATCRPGPPPGPSFIQAGRRP